MNLPAAARKLENLHAMAGSGRLGTASAAQARILSEASLIVRQYCVEGRVQGVGFRWFVHREASALALRGSVRNTEGSAVEVIAAGDAEALASLRSALEKGPRGSRVDRIKETDLPLATADSLRIFRIEGAW